jgi:NAD(P)-dependent dehydrogenase (short-subunit alcohol dehydrogenase family)
VPETVVLTGATRGIGRAAAAALLRHDATTRLVVPVRDSASTDLPAELSAVTGDDNVLAVRCDLADLAAVRAFAEEVRCRLDAGELPPLRGIACNAGLLTTSATRATVDGFELTFGVNVLSHQLLLRLLADRLAAPATVVLVSSGTHFGTFRHNYGSMPPPLWRDVAQLATPGTAPRASSVYAGRQAYVTTKLALVHLVHEWARRLPGGVRAVGYDPGLVTGTDFGRDFGSVGRFAYRVLLRPMAVLPLAATPRAAGERLAALVTGELPAASGDYVELGEVAPSSPESYDEDRERELWTETGRLLAPFAASPYGGAAS